MNTLTTQTSIGELGLNTDEELNFLSYWLNTPQEVFPIYCLDMRSWKKYLAPRGYTDQQIEEVKDACLSLLRVRAELVRKK